MRISDWSSDVCSSDLSFAAGCTDVKEGLEKADDTLSGTLLGAEGAQTGDSGEAPLTETDLATSLYESGLKLKSDGKDAEAFDRRSEEHTSELQSLMRISYAVFCLKKKKKKIPHNTKNTEHKLQIK